MRASKQASKQARRQAGRQALGMHSVGAMPWRGLLDFLPKLVNTQEYLFRTSEIVLIKVETNFNFEGILTV